MRKALKYTWIGNPPCWRSFSAEFSHPTVKRLLTTRQNDIGGPAKNTSKHMKWGSRRATNVVLASNNTPSDPPKSAYARSFLFDEPHRPRSKRQLSDKDGPLKDRTKFERDLASNQFAAILASPIRQCFFTRKSLPSAFLTKLIQAAPSESFDRPWIVPEGIIPAGASTLGEPRRFGFGKWIFSNSKIIGAMVKEGKYKMINAAAFIRPDLPQLIYAQMTYRVATGFQNLRQAGRSVVQLDLSNNRHSAVDEIKLNIITRSRERKSITVPRYDMAKLFENYPQGLATIRQECQRSKGELDNTTQDLWIGLYSTKNTIPLAVDLWKLCQMLPSSTSRTK
ncbi:hypothetical protein CPB97_010648 [Podila verticillata]|nr:hypothetical protein CPB97_010648 [Podila verticillata]